MCLRDFGRDVQSQPQSLTVPFARTQQQIAAATGLTAVHVNRMLRELRLAGVIDIRTSVARVLDHDALRKHASFNATGLAPPEQSEVSPR